MRLSEYQKQIQRTRNINDTELANYSMGLAGECGEVIDILKKHLFHGHYLNLEEVQKELGDVMWYIGNLCNVLGLDLAGVCEQNIEKLKKRYPNGFSITDSVNRVE